MVTNSESTGGWIRGALKVSFDYYWLVFLVIMGIAVATILAIAGFKLGLTIGPENLRYAYSSIFQGLAALGGIVLVFLTLTHQRSIKGIEDSSVVMRDCLRRIPGGQDFDSDSLNWNAIENWFRNSWCEKNLDPEAKALDIRFARYEKDSEKKHGANVFEFEILAGGGIGGELGIYVNRLDEIRRIRDSYYRASATLGRRSRERLNIRTVTWNTVILVLWFVLLMTLSLLLLLSLDNSPSPPFSQTAAAMLVAALTIAGVAHFIMYTSYVVGLLLEAPEESDYFTYTGFEKPYKTDEILRRIGQSLSVRPVPWSVYVKEDSTNQAT